MKQWWTVTKTGKCLKPTIILNYPHVCPIPKRKHRNNRTLIPPSKPTQQKNYVRKSTRDLNWTWTTSNIRKNPSSTSKPPSITTRPTSIKIQNPKRNKKTRRITLTTTTTLKIFRKSTVRATEIWRKRRKLVV